MLSSIPALPLCIWTYCESLHRLTAILCVVLLQLCYRLTATTLLPRARALIDAEVDPPP